MKVFKFGGASVKDAASVKNVASILKELEAKKVPYSDWPGTPGKVNVRTDGILQIYLQDPDGYWIEVNSVAQ